MSETRDLTLETWLRTEAAAAYDALVADPSRALSIDEVRGKLAALGSLPAAGTTRLS